MNEMYKSSGVDIKKGEEFVDYIKMQSQKFPHIIQSIGGFGGMTEIPPEYLAKNPIIVSSTDGVGTKLKIAQDVKIHNTIGIDLVAMCVNDIVTQGAQPLCFQDYISIGKLDLDITQNIMDGIIEGCSQAKCQLSGGETAEMPDMYKEGEYDLAGFTVGIVAKDDILPRKKSMQVGDMLIGIRSNGFHSNGFSLIRKILKENNISYHDNCPNSELEWTDILLKPTTIYVKLIMDILQKFRSDIKGIAHITGGGITENLPRILPDHLSSEINFSSWEMHEEFNIMQKLGNITQKEMRTVFNCGIGMILIVNQESSSNILQEINESHEAYKIGFLKNA